MALNRWIKLCATGVFTLLVACDVQTEVNASQPLTTEQHHRHWTSLGESYDITFQQQCFCLPDYLRPIRITVNNGTIVKAVFEDDNSTVPTLILNDLQTVSQIFTAIMSAESMPAESIKVEFDSRHHYPRDVKIDYDFRLSDDEIHWRLSKLTLHQQ